MPMNKHWMTMGHKQVSAAIAKWTPAVRMQPLGRLQPSPGRARVSCVPGESLAGTGAIGRVREQQSRPHFGRLTMNYQAQPATRSEEPLLLGLIGPPGGGKTLSALKLAKGIQSIRGGDIIVLDTEGGRARKYNDLIPFKIVEMPPNARSDAFLAAIMAQLPAKPAAIIVDSDV
jgi:hypothetical protein